MTDPWKLSMSMDNLSDNLKSSRQFLSISSRIQTVDDE